MNERVIEVVVSSVTAESCLYPSCPSLLVVFSRVVYIYVSLQCYAMDDTLANYTFETTQWVCPSVCPYVMVNEIVRVKLQLRRNRKDQCFRISVVLPRMSFKLIRVGKKARSPLYVDTCKTKTETVRSSDMTSFV